MNSFVAFDLETTGFEAGKDEIIEIGLAKFENGKVVEKLDVLVRPNQEVPKVVLAITGIDEAGLKTAKPFEDYREAVIKFIDKNIIVGHNVEFDLNFLKAEGIEFPDNIVLDTWHLALVFYPRAESHSLEILADQLGILPEASHRAYFDAETSGFLFLNLLLERDKVDKNVKKGFDAILENSSSQIKEFFLLDKSTYGNFKLKELHREPTLFPKSFTNSKNLESALSSGENALVEVNATLKDILESSNQEGSLIAIPEQQISEFVEVSGGAKTEMPFLFGPKNYLSPKLFEKFKNTKLNDKKTLFCLKMEKFLSESTSLLKNEVSVLWDETGFWKQVSGDLDQFGENLKKFNKSSFGVTDLSTLLQHKLEFEKLILWEADELEDNIAETLGWHLNSKNTDYLGEELSSFFEEHNLKLDLLENLKAEFEMFWGLLGIFCRNYVQEKSPYTMYAPIDSYSRTRVDFDRLVSGIMKIKENMEKVSVEIKKIDQENNVLEELAQIKNNLNTIFVEPKSGGVYWGYIRGEEPIVGVEGRPIKADSIISTKILPNFKSSIFVASSLTLDESLDFVKNRLGLSDFTEKIVDTDIRPEISVLEGFSPKQPNYGFDMAEFILELNKNRKGNFVFLFSNGGDLFRVYEKLLEAQIETPIVAQLAGMSIKKIRQAMLKQKGIFLLLNSVVTKRFFINEIELLAVTKLPFEVFSHPLIKKRQDAYGNGFKDYLLRKSILKINKIIARFLQFDLSAKVIVTDPALTTKEYGQDVVENLNGQVEVISKNELLD